MPRIQVILERAKRGYARVVIDGADVTESILSVHLQDSGIALFSHDAPLLRSISAHLEYSSLGYIARSSNVEILTASI